MIDAAMAHEIVWAANRRFFDSKLTEHGVQAVLAVAREETHFGQAVFEAPPPGPPRPVPNPDNWGSIHAPSATAAGMFYQGGVAIRDVHADGKPYKTFARAYPDATHGAADLIALLWRDVGPLLNTGSAADIVRMMHKLGYFELAVSEYEKRFCSAARANAKEGGWQDLFF